jgi:hypothetical protein
MQEPTQKQWHFGSNWPGKRCGANTRRGTACQKPALSGKKRCQLHGGRAGAPSGDRNGNYRHGRYTKTEMAKRRLAAERIAALAALGRKIGLFGR